MPKGPLDASADEMLVRAHSLKDETETKELYRDWAETYDDTMVGGLGYLSPEKAAKLLALYVSDNNACILDVGTGTGLVGKELKTLGYSNIEGIDYSAPMLEVAHATGAYQNLHEADLNEPLSIADNTYDALICIGTFTHGHVGADCLDELFRILKPGGNFVTAIRKDYWEPAGFAAKIEELTRKGEISTVANDEDNNYTDSEEAESWFIVWVKCQG